MKLKRFIAILLVLMLSWTISYADNEPIDALLSSVIQDDYPEQQLFDYAPIGQGNVEYIVLARDSTNKPVAMIVNTEQPTAGVEFCNTSIMEGIPLDKNTVQIMDHTTT